MVVATVHTELALERANSARLQEQLSAVLATIARLEEKLDDAAARNTELLAQLSLLTQEVAKSNDRIRELTAAVDRHRRKKTEWRAEAPPSPPPDVDAATRKAFEDRPNPPAPLGPVNDRPRQKQRPTGRRPLPDLPIDETLVEPGPCPCGCQRFDRIDEEVEDKLDIRVTKRIRRTRRVVGRCVVCGKRSTGEAPPSPFARSKLTPESLAYLIVQRFQLLVPLDRLSRYFGVQGVALAKSFLVSQSEAVAELLEGLDGEHWRELQACGRMDTDATGLSVQVKGVGLHKGYLEVYHQGLTVVFQYEAEKGGVTQAEKLAKFEGVLMVDAESRYNEAIRRNPKIREANCNAHPRRKLRDAEAVNPVLAKEAGAFVGAWFDQEELARKAGLTGAALLAWRQERTRPQVEAFRVWMDAVEPTLPPSDPVGKVIRYYRNHWKALTLFLTDATIPLDNSAAEREFQPVAKYRLSSLFVGSSEAAHRAAILLGIVATCRRHKVDTEAYLVWFFERRGTWRHKYAHLTVAELTPTAYVRWKAAQSS